MLFFDNKPASKHAQTKEIWFYDFRTNIHFTLKKNPLKLSDLADFIECYHPSNILQRKETYHANTNPEGRWRRFTFDEIVERDKTSLDITWLKDDSLPDLDNLPDPDVLANDIFENLRAGIERFEEIMVTINGGVRAAGRVHSPWTPTLGKTRKKWPSRCSQTAWRC